MIVMMIVVVGTGHWQEVSFPKVQGMKGCIEQCQLHPEAAGMQFNDDGWCGCLKLAEGTTWRDGACRTRQRTSPKPEPLCSARFLASSPSSALNMLRMCDAISQGFRSRSDRVQRRESAKLAETAPTAHFAWCFCCVIASAV